VSMHMLCSLPWQIQPSRRRLAWCHNVTGLRSHLSYAFPWTENAACCLLSALFVHSILPSIRVRTTPDRLPAQRSPCHTATYRVPLI
jgi:hypothetical protein